MNADPQLEFLVRSMSHFEMWYLGEQRQSHVAYLDDVAVPVWVRQSADRHVGVAYCLHLSDIW